MFTGGERFGCTTLLGADAAVVCPAVFVAVTDTSTVLPTSPLVSVYEADVADPISEQFSPPESQRRHWYA
jgi:hypothetical protein